MKIIDAHCHFDPVIEKESGLIIPKLGIDYTVSGLQDGMAKAGIVHSVLISTRFQTNHHVRDLARKYPARFSAAATLSRARGFAKSILELRKDLRRKSYVAIKFYLGYEKLNPLDKKWDRVYLLAQKYRIPIIFHTGDTLGPNAHLRFSHPLQLDELAVKFPKLKIVIAHLGNPWLLDAAEVVYKNPNVYADLSGFFIGEQKPDKYMLLRLDTALSYCGTARIFFGTDYPLIRQADYVPFVKKLHIGKKQLADVLFNNANRLYDLGLK